MGGWPRGGRGQEQRDSPPPPRSWEQWATHHRAGMNNSETVRSFWQATSTAQCEMSPKELPFSVALAWGAFLVKSGVNLRDPALEELGGDIEGNKCIAKVGNHIVQPRTQASL